MIFNEVSLKICDSKDKRSFIIHNDVTSATFVVFIYGSHCKRLSELWQFRYIMLIHSQCVSTDIDWM